MLFGRKQSVISPFDLMRLDTSPHSTQGGMPLGLEWWKMKKLTQMMKNENLAWFTCSHDRKKDDQAAFYSNTCEVLVMQTVLLSTHKINEEGSLEVIALDNPVWKSMRIPWWRLIYYHRLINKSQCSRRSKTFKKFCCQKLW